MAELNETGLAKSKRKKHPVKIEMTPMVDLAFLLLTFFVLAATFNKPRILKLTLPPRKADKMPRNSVSNALTLIMGKNQELFWYWGKMEKDRLLSRTTYSEEGLRQLLQERNAYMIHKLADYNHKWAQSERLSGKNKAGNKEISNELQNLQRDPRALVVIVKNEGKALYGNVVDIVDELRISQVGSYFIADDNLSELEKEKIETWRNHKTAL